MPINRSIAVRLRSLKNLLSGVAASRIREEASQVRERQKKSMRVGVVVDINLNTAMIDGPATAGIASGTMRGSPSGSLPNIPSGRGNIILIAIRNRIMPPEIEIASLVRFRISRRYRPKNR